ncbi:uncharacterized protein N7496_001029 [Penicillium cataractarum]|uniref:SP-RING-type domain-containing protein n=1 Tax=Penicillium cataractarum TaxID=2100454 RepID=A0A9X0B6J6_9EURO|nr:uncharacterized protein N7496_001029 [Penicillium cataractarum]KAJ5389961.1 hypothetical protein N7496_001029 [Penicillium cataractarum]
MVSPRIQRSRRPADHLEESNSTASLFLGGVRRDWMASAGASHPREARLAAMSHPKSPNSPPVAAPSKVSRGIHHPGPAELALMSPVTPGANLQQSESASSLQAHPPTTSKPDPPKNPLPSPVPSPGSHPSPILSPPPTIPSNDPSVAALAVPPASDKPPAVATVNPQPRRDESASPRQPASNQPSPPSVQNPTPRPSVSAASEPSEIVPSSATVPHPADPGSRPLHGITNGIQAQSVQNPMGPNQSPSMGVNARVDTPGSHAIGSPLQKALNQPSSYEWILWRECANSLLTEARESSLDVGGPRALLLLNACSDYDKDLFYLVLHQIFCEMSRDANVLLARLPVLRDERCQIGITKLAELLEDNSKLPPSLLEAFCVFPLPLEQFINAPWYQGILDQVVGCLSCLVTQFSFLKTETHRRIYERCYPPLVKELRQEYGVTSPVLLGVIFMSICRHVYDTKRIDLLQRHFKKDLFLVSKNAGPDAHLALIEDYRRIPMRGRPSAAPPRPPMPVHQSQHPPQPRPAAPAGYSAPSPVIDSPAIVSPALQANGQNHPAYPSLHIQSPISSIIPQNLQHAQYIDQHGHPISAQQVWQMSRMAHLAQGQAQDHQAQPVLLQPVNPAQGQGQNAQRGPVYMVVANQAPQVLIPVSTVPSQADPSPSPSQPSVLGWPSQVVQQQQQQQPQQPPTRHMSTGDTTTQFSAASHAIETTVTSRTSHSRARQPPSIRPVPASSPTVQVPQTQASRPRVPAMSPLLPPEGYRAPQTVQPNPMRLGLHQADLRDPVKQLVRRTPNGLEETALYQYLNGFMLDPTQIDPDVFGYRWKFSISPDDYQRFPRYADRGQGQRLVRTYQPGCRTYRLRITALPDSKKEEVQTFWPTANTTWPSVLYIFVNNNEMYVRRKVHNGKDLPLDITRHLHEGENEVNVHFLLATNECKNFHYVAGVETMDISEYNEVLALTHHVPASETRANIKKRLKPNTDDDELAVVTDSLTVPLIDPFMAQIFNTPARSSKCNHIECFDLDTFITTRKSQSGTSPMIDNWFCPICKADARPQFLVVDHFFVEVRDAIVKRGVLDTAQSIQIRADGSWTVKAVSDDASPSSPTRSRLSQPPSSGKRKADSMTGAVEQNARTKHESTPTAPAQDPVVIEID